ncbi:LLM class flavin-dependent oxidoreductase [Micromonospora endophytica]|uniref:LLM class flavin-dependent oxidoreductase n=1 Tax=Micromonospora endophytica TaxID=515350 RepID=A0A2W2CNH2_9ACTN|nr:LLM class flavin-dependent oxidoreductase [Micromonospora endophytica]PZG01036.1 LLM class flavin-dependent oxidoreductase [Micromonospora endophytica]RIW47922.1 LLM class flavin-dependent oxidoreductase [Micromonospora endophytica]BCJ62295.1 monooxygenase [Micromonospora endophytica]
MSTAVQLALGVGVPDPHRSDGPTVVSLAAARTIAAVAEQVGLAAIRLVDGGPSGRTLDPTVVAGYLAGVHGGVGYVTEIPTTRHAPYNVARRVLSLDRATAGRVGIALQAGQGDEVSAVTAPVPDATDPTRRWTEYARVLTRLWESFPQSALIGDQQAGVVVDTARVTPINHEGVFYRVAGPLDGPSSRQGRPVIVADLGALDATAVAESVDVVVVDRSSAADADATVTEALGRVGRSRHDVALLGRADLAGYTPATAGTYGDELRDWAAEHRLDGVELVAKGGSDAIVTALRTVVPRLTDPASTPATLRAALGLSEVAAVLA